MTSAPASPASLASQPQGPGALPLDVAQALAPSESAAASPAWTRRLARTHYENFSVVSMLLPRRLRQDFCNVYAFCRIADDLSDEIADPAVSLGLLSQLAADVSACREGRASSTLLVPLAQTFARHPRLPLQPFLDLIGAFEQDRRVSRYATYNDLLDYCRRSANPVGRIVLHLCGTHDEQAHKLADCICTGLQLANFWQDIRVDLVRRDRLYVPQQTMSRFKISERQVREGPCDERVVEMIRFEVDRTEDLFDRGRGLYPMLDGRIRAHMRLFSAGGRAVLEAIRRCGYDTLAQRPTLSKLQKSALVGRATLAWIGGVFYGLVGARRGAPARVPSDA